MDVEGRALLKDSVGAFQDLSERLGLGKASIRHGVEVSKVDDRSNPTGALGDREDILRGA